MKRSPAIDVYGWVARVPAGWYHLFIHTNSCNKTIPAIVLPGADRSINVALNPMTTDTLLDMFTGVAGFVPSDVVQAKLEAMGRYHYYPHTVPVRSGAYYFDDVINGPWMLTFSLASGAEVHFAVRLGGPGTRPLRRDFSRKDILGASLRVGSPFSSPTQLARGPDHSMWALNAQGNSAVLVADDGIRRIVTMPMFNALPSSIASDPLGNAWLTESRVGRIAKVSPAGEIVEFPVKDTASPKTIVRGGDGRMWFIDDMHSAVTAVGKDGAMESYAVPGVPEGLALGGDDRVWVCGQKFASAVDEKGVVVSFPLSDEFDYIVVGKDAIWMSGGGTIDRLTYDGSLRSVDVPIDGSRPVMLVATTDGRAWFTDQQGALIGSVDGRGHVALQYADYQPAGIVAAALGENGDPWFAMPEAHAAEVISLADKTIAAYFPTTYGGDPAYLQTDDKGRMWFSEPASNAIGYFDIEGDLMGQRPHTFPLPVP